MMNRKEFLKQTFRYSAATCLGMHMLSNKSILAAFNSSGNKPEDAFTALFSWLEETLNTDLTAYFDKKTTEYTILTEIKDGWGKIDTVDLFRGLTTKHGTKAIDTMRQFIKKTSVPYWSGRGQEEATNGTELESFTNILWNPNSNDFKFTTERVEDKYYYKVNNCPFAKLANNTEMHDWVYAMACITDYYMVPAFSKEIGFGRTKTLVQGDDYCNHSYYYRQKETASDALLGYCGLYCGGCSQRQKTEAYDAIDFNKQHYYETCEGCNSGVCASWCTSCEIKACAREKNLRVCFNCVEYPCSKMTAFIESEEYPYHKEVDANMRQFNQMGLTQWLETKKAEYQCDNCGTPFNFFSETCDKCGKKV